MDTGRIVNGRTELSSGLCFMLLSKYRDFTPAELISGATIIFRVACVKLWRFINKIIDADERLCHDDSMNKEAQKLGRMANGVPKKYSAEQIKIRTERLILARSKRWPKINQNNSCIT